MRVLLFVLVVLVCGLQSTSHAQCIFDGRYLCTHVSEPQTPPFLVRFDHESGQYLRHGLDTLCDESGVAEVAGDAQIEYTTTHCSSECVNPEQCSVGSVTVHTLEASTATETLTGAQRVCTEWSGQEGEGEGGEISCRLSDRVMSQEQLRGGCVVDGTYHCKYLIDGPWPPYETSFSRGDGRYQLHVPYFGCHFGGAWRISDGAFVSIFHDELECGDLCGPACVDGHPHEDVFLSSFVREGPNEDREDDDDEDGSGAEAPVCDEYYMVDLVGPLFCEKRHAHGQDTCETRGLYLCRYDVLQPRIKDFTLRIEGEGDGRRWVRHNIDTACDIRGGSFFSSNNHNRYTGGQCVSTASGSCDPETCERFSSFEHTVYSSLAHKDDEYCHTWSSSDDYGGSFQCAALEEEDEEEGKGMQTQAELRAGCEIAGAYLCSYTDEDARGPLHWLMMKENKFEAFVPIEPQCAYSGTYRLAADSSDAAAVVFENTVYEENCELLLYTQRGSTLESILAVKEDSDDDDDGVCDSFTAHDAYGTQHCTHYSENHARDECDLHERYYCRRPVLTPAITKYNLHFLVEHFEDGTFYRHKFDTFCDVFGEFRKIGNERIEYVPTRISDGCAANASAPFEFDLYSTSLLEDDEETCGEWTHTGPEGEGFICTRFEYRPQEELKQCKIDGPYVCTQDEDAGLPPFTTSYINDELLFSLSFEGLECLQNGDYAVNPNHLTSTIFTEYDIFNCPEALDEAILHEDILTHVEDKNGDGTCEFFRAIDLITTIRCRIYGSEQSEYNYSWSAASMRAPAPLVLLLLVAAMLLYTPML